MRPIRRGQTWRGRDGQLYTVLGVSAEAVTLRDSEGRPVAVPMAEFAAFDTLPSGACAYRYARVLSAAELAEPRGD